ncbi:MAG: N-methyl-L-tryptophan oxidase [Planctomycetaceae bacterium]|nr:N-methyl-L-tryptophan oxidase [Planctomycetaceae bacterium]
MAEVFDVIVLGVGGFGSGAVYHLARRGLRVLGFDRFGPAHDQGSSHGETRIIRKAYFEHPDYVPLLLRAYDLWAELEAESQQQLFWQCGLLLAGLPDSEAISGARLSASQHGLTIQNLSASAAEKRWPGFRVPDAFDAVFEPDAGFLKVEDCVRTHLDCAVAHGATLLFNEPVVSWSSTGREVRVRTATREFVAASLVITAGSWAASVLADLKLPLQVLRKPIFWFETTSPTYNLDSRMPTFYFEMPADVGHVSNVPQTFYGFPSLDGQVLKVAQHSGGEPIADPLLVDRQFHDADVRPIANFLQACLPGVRSCPARHSVCLYTVTPDRHFVVDRHPEFSNVVIGCGFSGHGFKFTSVLGNAFADLATAGRTDLPVEFLSLKRLRV